MILADTSAWIEYLRGSEHPVDLALRPLAGRYDLVVTEPVVMELLAGIRTERDMTRVTDVLSEYPIVPAGGLDTYVKAAEIYRICRRGGDTIRNTIDCLVAAVAIRVDAPILHNDRDFDAIARHTDLRVHPVP